MNTYIDVTLCLRIHDAEAFRRAAYRDALERGLEDDDAQSYLRPEETELESCALMLLDKPLDGAETEDSSAEEVTARMSAP